MAAKGRGAKASGGYQQELQQALQAQREGRLAEAEQGYRFVLSRKPRHLQANHLLGLLYFGVGELAAARAQLETALKHHPGEAEVHNNLGNVLRAIGDVDAAQAAHGKATALAPRNGRYHADLAWSFSEAGDLERARNTFEQAAELDGSLAATQMGLGNTLRDLGEVPPAIGAFRKALELQPGWSEALLRLTQMQDYSGGAHAEDAAAVERAWEVCPPVDPGRIDIGFARAQISRQRGEPAKAFESLGQAHGLLAQREPFNREDTRAYFDAIKQAPLLAPGPPAADRPRPIFVVGLPRSGTSLVEQILASHSQVAGAGELPAMGNICQRLEKDSGTRFAAAYAALNDDQRQQVAGAYREQLERAGDGVEWIVDKLPANFLAIGLIQSLLPDALILHCQREAAATCWSIYSTRFAQPHPFAHDLADLGFYHGLYSDLMTHWDNVLRGRVIPVQYEALVSDPDTQIPALLAHASLEAEPACLAFHDNRRPVRTASALQVRKPLYATSLSAYREFDDYLQPLYGALEEHGAAPENPGHD